MRRPGRITGPRRQPRLLRQADRGGLHQVRRPLLHGLEVCREARLVWGDASEQMVGPPGFEGGVAKRRKSRKPRSKGLTSSRERRQIGAFRARVPPESHHPRGVLATSQDRLRVSKTPSSWNCGELARRFPSPEISPPAALGPRRSLSRPLKVSPRPFSGSRSQAVERRFPSGFRGLEVARQRHRARLPDRPPGSNRPAPGPRRRAFPCLRGEEGMEQGGRRVSLSSSKCRLGPGKRADLIWIKALASQPVHDGSESRRIRRKGGGFRMRKAGEHWRSKGRTPRGSSRALWTPGPTPDPVNHHSPSNRLTRVRGVSISIPSYPDARSHARSPDPKQVAWPGNAQQENSDSRWCHGTTWV
jgi:hypothetical protein